MATAPRFFAGTFPTRPAHIFTSSGYVTGMTFGHHCTPPGGSGSHAAAATAPTTMAAGLPPVDRRRRATVW